MPAVLGQLPFIASLNMIKKVRFLLIFFIAVSALISRALPLQAQFSDDIDISFFSESEMLHVGDPVHLTLEVKHPAGYEVVIPTLPPVWGDYEVRSQQLVEVVDNGDGTETTRYDIEVTLFEIGTFQTDTLPISLRDDTGQVIERVAPQVSLRVESILDESDTNLRDIKPQVFLSDPFAWLRTTGTILLVLLALLIIWWLYRRISRRLATGAVIPEPAPYVDPRPAYQIAYEELDRIERLDLPGQGRFKEYYSLVTDCLRLYLGRMYRVPAIDLTTTETQRALEKSPLIVEYTRQFIDLFTEGDFVKFARFVPGVESARQAIPLARRLVDGTKIIEPEVPEPAENISEEKTVIEEAV